MLHLLYIISAFLIEIIIDLRAKDWFFFFTYLVFLSETSTIVYLLSVLNKCWWNSRMPNLDFQNSRDNWINTVKRKFLCLNDFCPLVTLTTNADDTLCLDI